MNFIMSSRVRETKQKICKPQISVQKLMIGMPSLIWSPESPLALSVITFHKFFSLESVSIKKKI